MRPRLRVAPAVKRNDADLVIDLAAAYGTELDPWQADVLAAGCGIRPNGYWAAKTVGCNVARQNGKSLMLVLRGLAGPLLFGEHTVVLSAHQQKTSRELFLSMTGFFDNFDDLRKRVKSVTSALGREEIWLKDGCRFFFPARTRQTMRGWTIDCYLADEAQFITDEQWESALPAMSARPNAQSWMFGTAPPTVSDGHVFGRLRRAAYERADKGLAWVEYGAPAGANLDDRAHWLGANPGRVALEAMEAERRELSAGGFARERLNIWPATSAASVIEPATWEALRKPGPADDVPPVALALDASPQREIVIGGAWLLEGGRVHVELLTAAQLNAESALRWLVGRAGRTIPVIMDNFSPVASLLPELLAAKVNVTMVHAREVGNACGGFLDDLQAGRISHVGQPLLNAAVCGARRRPLGDAGAFVWDRRDSNVFVAALVAVTLARYGAHKGQIRRKAPGGGKVMVF